MNKNHEKTREKFIKKVGTSIGIIFNKEERNLFDLHVNDKILLTFSKVEDTKNIEGEKEC